MFFVGVTFLGALAQLLLKNAMNKEVHDIQQLWMLVQSNYMFFLTGVICYGLAFAGYLVLVSKMRIHILYPLQVALSFFFVYLLSFWALKETIILKEVFSLLLILTGILGMIL